jgi:hypothetical protein
MIIRVNGLKRNLCVDFVFTACMVSVFLFPYQIWGQATEKTRTDSTTNSPLELSGTVEIGVQGFDIQGGHTAKFEEVRDVAKGFLVQKLKLNFGSPGSPYFLSLRGLELSETDRSITMEAGRVGKFRTKFVWDQTPHYFGTGQSFLIRTGPGYYSVDPTLRAALQAVTLPDSMRTPVNGALPTLVRQQLLTAPLTEVRLRRDQAVFTAEYEVSNNIEIYTRFSWLRNRGTRPMSAGTFVRRPVPGNGLPDIGGSWEGIGQEFLEPVDQRTTQFKLGIRYIAERWSAGADYDLSFFRNRVDSVIFENPFRVTDQEGCLPNSMPPPTLTCGASNRFRTVHWQTDLAPNNDYHRFTFWAKVDLTSHTQVRGNVSVAFLSQNDAFLPWTLNTAIVPTHWDAASPVVDPTDVNELPAQSLQGEMRDINQEFALVDRHRSFRFHARYRSQSLDNQSPMIEFPGYAAFGDSTWRAPATDFYNLPIDNLDWDFRRQNAEAGFVWEAAPELTWRVDYEWEGWNRKFRDVNRNNQHSVRNRLEFEHYLAGAPRSSNDVKKSGGSKEVRVTTPTILRLKLDYTYANRRALAYNTQPLSFNSAFPGSPVGGNTTAWEVLRTTVMNEGQPIEFNLLRRYDESDRIRNDASFTVEYLRGPNTHFSASYRYMADEHDKSFYGRLFNRFSYIDAEFSHTFETAFFFVNYSRETNQYAYRDLAHLLPNPPAPPGSIVQGVLAQFPIANTWERTSRSNLDSFEFGVNMAPQQGILEKWQFDLSYALSFTRERISTANPFVVRADSILHAGANPYPDTVVRRQDVNLAITRRITDKYEIGVRYWYEPYTQDDFSYNGLAPYIHGNATSDLPKYLFQDARYASYHANVASVFVRYTF